MYRRLRTLACALGAVLLVAPAAAQAKIIEVGQTATPNPPSCPGSPCQAVSRTTAYQVKVGADRKSFVVPAAGRIVAWSITLGNPGAKQRKFFEDALGGAAKAGITVLRPGKRLMHTVTGQGPQETLTPYFGQTVQFPLPTTLVVRKGDVIALTVSTWAPALALGLGNDSSWRASRPAKKCGDTMTQTAQLRTATTTQYRCLYQTARVTYSATLVTTPVPPKAPPTPKASPTPTATPTPTPTPKQP
jgi:hypothetical protein